MEESMIKLKNVSDLELVSHLELEIQSYVLNVLTTLDESYGVERDLLSDLEGYVAIITNPIEITELETLHNCDLTEDPIPEYVDFIFIDSNPTYTASLFLLSSDYGIIMIVPYEITPIRLLK